MPQAPREREREREKERSARWREDTSAARSARQLRRWDRLQAARFTNLSPFETHQSPPPNKRKLITTITSNTLPTSNNNQSQITICIKLSGDHHGRKKKYFKHVWRKRRGSISVREERDDGFGRWWVWLCGFGCWFCLMWLVRFSGDWVCWDWWVWLVIGYVVISGFRLWLGLVDFVVKDGAWWILPVILFVVIGGDWRRCCWRWVFDCCCYGLDWWEAGDEFFWVWIGLVLWDFRIGWFRCWENGDLDFNFWIVVLIQDTFRYHFIWFFVFNSVFNFLYLVKINKLIFF